MHETHFFLISIAIIFISAISIYFYKILKNTQQKKRIQKGIKLELKAQEVLKKQGYTIVSHHQQISYTLQDNSSPITILLESDYIVKKQGKTFLAEVKSGEHTANIMYAQTRRQLLEYACATNYDGYLLIDMHHETIHTIVFPFYKKNHDSNRNQVMVISIGASIVILWFLPTIYQSIGYLVLGLLCIFGGVRTIKTKN